MNKEQFLAELQKGLSGLPQAEIDDRLAFYGEFIDDHIEEGMTEEEAVAELGGTDRIIARILEEIPLPKLVHNRIKPKRALQAWEIVLLILGSPIWLSLLGAAFSVLLAGYAVIWAMILTIWAVEAALIASGIGGILALIPLWMQGHPLPGLAMLGAGLFCLGAAVFLFFGCLAATKGNLLLTKTVVLWIKSRFVGKEAAK